MARMVRVSVSLWYVPSIPLWNPYSLRAAALALSASAGSVTPFAPSLDCQPANELGRSGRGTETETACEGEGCAGAGFGLAGAWAITAAEPASMAELIKTAIQSLNVSSSLPLSSILSQETVFRGWAFYLDTARRRKVPWACPRV